MLKLFMSLVTKIEKELIYEIALYLLSIALISFLYTENPPLIFLLIALIIFGTKIWYKRRDVIYFLCGAIAGPFAEIICIHFGAWRYFNPTLLGIPIWLPIAWGFVTVLIMRFAEAILKTKVK